MQRIRLFSVAVALALAPLYAQECKVKVLAPVLDDLGNHWKPGTVLPVDIERVSGDAASFCASGGSCIPARVNGVDALQLLNCKAGTALGGGDFRLVPSARLAGEAEASALQRRRDATEKLSGLGFSNASAGSLADEYVHRPQSHDGQLVARALAGSKAALASLRRTHP